MRPPVLAHTRFLENRGALAGPEHREIFHYIFRTNMWGGVVSRSGLGSSSAETERLRREIPALLRRVGAQTLLDVPCGDFFWMSNADLDGVAYTGADIVPEIIAQNTEKYGEAPGTREFLRLDLVTDPLPTADLVLCRDCLVHFSFGRATAALANIRASGAEYLLATTFPDHEVNTDIEDGDWRLLNLMRPPFNLPPPLELIVEGCEEGDGAYADKSLGLWRICEIP